MNSPYQVPKQMLVEGREKTDTDVTVSRATEC